MERSFVLIIAFHGMVATGTNCHPTGDGNCCGCLSDDPATPSDPASFRGVCESCSCYYCPPCCGLDPSIITGTCESTPCFVPNNKQSDPWIFPLMGCAMGIGFLLWCYCTRPVRTCYYRIYGFPERNAPFHSDVCQPQSASLYDDNEYKSSSYEYPTTSYESTYKPPVHYKHSDGHLRGYREY
jgi:hypothetical protein